MGAVLRCYSCCKFLGKLSGFDMQMNAQSSAQDKRPATSPFCSGSKAPRCVLTLRQHTFDGAPLLPKRRESDPPKAEAAQIHNRHFASGALMRPPHVRRTM